jgi:hypothetical protein
MSDLAHALDLTRDFLTRYVVFASPEQADAAALWTGHTWTYDESDTTAYLAIQSPEKRSGKTRLLECLRLVVRQPLPMAGASIAALFRLIEERHPTLLIDEADAAFGKRGPDTEDLRGLLNNGYRRGIPYWRVVGEGKKMHVESFDVFCPKAVASIGRLPDTVQDRSIVLALKRRARHEPVERFRFRQAEQETATIREWWESLAAKPSLPEQADVPAELDDRASDSWEPLLMLADVAGGAWPAKARRAAVLLSGGAAPEDDTLSVQLLADVRFVFADRKAERLPTAVLLERLHALEDSPWADYRDRGLKPHGLSRLLRPYAIGPRLLKFGAQPARGYELEQFADAFARYLPLSVQTPSERYSVTSEHESERGSNGVTDQRPVAEERQKGSDGVVVGPATAAAPAYNAKADELQAALGWPPRHKEETTVSDPIIGTPAAPSEPAQIEHPLASGAQPAPAEPVQVDHLLAGDHFTDPEVVDYSTASEWADAMKAPE